MRALSRILDGNACLNRINTIINIKDNEYE